MRSTCPSFPTPFPLPFSPFILILLENLFLPSYPFFRFDHDEAEALLILNSVYA